MEKERENLPSGGSHQKVIGKQKDLTDQKRGCRGENRGGWKKKDIRGKKEVNTNTKCTKRGALLHLGNKKTKKKLREQKIKLSGKVNARQSRWGKLGRIRRLTTTWIQRRGGTGFQSGKKGQKTRKKRKGYKASPGGWRKSVRVPKKNRYFDKGGNIRESYSGP